MSWDDATDRSHPASPRRRQEARQQGQVWQSGELASALMTGGLALLLMWQGPVLVRACAGLLRGALTSTPTLRADQLGTSWAHQPAIALGGALVGLLLGLWLLAILVRFVQVGPLLVPDLVRPRADRISPASGLRRVFGLSALVRGPLWLLRLLLVVTVVGWTLTNELHLGRNFGHASPAELTLRLGELLVSFAVRLSGGLLVVALVDAGWQWWSHERRLQMTAEEVQAEHRDANRMRRDRYRGVRPQSLSADPVGSV